MSPTPPRFDWPRLIGAVAVAGTLAALAATAPLLAAADDWDRLPVNETWTTECGACHVAYPPRALPARSWRALMDGLDRHFGTDASLDPRAAAEVRAFLERHAGRDPGGPRTIRVTETRWFRHEHDEIPPAVWRRPAVKSPANCGACHRGAEQGVFDDDAVRIPR